jgi:hypothetical protein
VIIDEQRADAQQAGVQRGGVSVDLTDLARRIALGELEPGEWLSRAKQT